MIDPLHRVLVCEDDRMTRALLERMLADIGLTCVRVLGDAQSLEAEVRDFDPSLVLLDRHTGGLDGMAALRLLADRDPGRSRRTVCLVTADARPEVRAQAMAYGADGVLFKPFDRTLFGSAIEELLAGRGGPAAPTGSGQLPPQRRAVVDTARARQPELHAKNAELRARIAELQAENAELRAANEAKGAFLSRASHELRTPLTSVLGFADLLAKARLGEQPELWANTILKAGRHLLGLLNDLLDFSRIDSGELFLSLEPVAVSAVCADTVDLIRLAAEAKGIAVSAELAEVHGVYVLADHQRLRQVLLNLMSNAIKYNRPGGEVRLTTSCPSKDELIIEVTDTGRGMTAEQLERLFVAFERLDATQDGVEGTGLGLVLSRRLTESMRGTLTVASTVGTGSTFTVALGRVEPSALADEPRTDDQSLSTRRYAEPRRVLYVEDLVANVDLMRDVLRHRPDVTLFPVMHGELALELAHKHRPDLIVLDVHLPDLGGEGVLAQLRADRQLRDTPVIILSADDTSAQQQRLLAAGADHYLTKPIVVRRLLHLFDHHLDAEVLARPVIPGSDPATEQLDAGDPR